MEGYEGLDRVTVAEAARRLKVKEQAIRKRIARGTLQHDKGEDGRVYVYIASEPEDEVQGEYTQANTHLEALVDTLQEQNRFLREELARKDAILLNMTEAMKALTLPAQEEPLEPPRAPTETSGPPGRADSSPTTGGAQEGSERPWWRRVFGG
jgi:hypothetical protein